MRIALLAGLAAVALPALTAVPAVAQSRAEEQRMDQAQARFDREYSIYQDAMRRYRSSRGGYGSYSSPRDGYAANDPRYSDDRYEDGYDPSRYYRQGNYQTRTLSADDRVYAGTDGRYYCKRSDGTTGLIVGAAGGGVLGNVIDGGHSRGVGTLLGAAVGALAGRAVERSNSQVQCQ